MVRDRGSQFVDSFDEIFRTEGLKILERIRLHDLRHSHATALLAAGVNVRVVADRLGHASVAFTIDCYGHSLPGQQREAANAVAALVAGDRL
ncbi:MAG: tyrosine-type recombinase/integrase [Acidimicrobiia bacterium]|nr:tyrosine-type recombinase/integrase [Acidimicrobiia bacterium]